MPAVKVTVQMPVGITDVIAHPARAGDIPLTDASSPGRVAGSRTAPIGQFPVQRPVSEHARAVLVFPSLVDLRNGTVVHWIGAAVVGHAGSTGPATAAHGPHPPPPPPPLLRPRRRPSTRLTRTTTTVATMPGSGSSSRRGSRRDRGRRLLSGGAALEAHLRPGGAPRVPSCSRCRGPLRHREARLPVDDQKVEPRMPGLQFQDPLRRRPGLAGQPQRRDRCHRRLRRRALPPLRAAGDLRERQLTVGLPESGSVREWRSRSRRVRRPIPNWEKLAGGDVWAWHDHRIHYMSPIPPPRSRRSRASRITCSTGRFPRPRTASVLHRGQPRLQAASEQEPTSRSTRHRPRCARSAPGWSASSPCAASDLALWSRAPSRPCLRRGGCPRPSRRSRRRAGSGVLRRRPTSAVPSSFSSK